MLLLILCIVHLKLSGVDAALDIGIPVEEIDLPQGKIIGTMSLSGDYRKYLGIPYATVLERFQAPGDPPKWEDTFYANEDSPACPQYIPLLPRSSPIVGSEQCLGLNVFTPIITQNETLPVMVFIYGGGWYWGSNNQFIYDPKPLVQKKVIVVTINYRVGVLGFLCLRNKGAPGNAGLKDQVAALKWVKNNIQYFGGNPDSVTLFGGSNGAVSINYLIMSPLANGLFHRAIMQSGTALTSLSYDADPIKTASTIAADLGFNSSDPNELLEFYKRASIDDLIAKTHKDIKNNVLAQFIFRPCVEVADKEALITGKTFEQFPITKYNSNLEVIVGYNDKEGRIFASQYNYTGYQKVLQDFTQIIPQDLKFNNESEKNSFIEDVKKMYFETNKGGSGFYKGLIQYFSDAFVTYASVALTEHFLQNPNVSVYNYYFTYDSDRNIAKFIEGMQGEPGASHGDELFYLFQPPMLDLLPLKQDDAEMIYKMTTMWSYFTLTGNPSIPAGLPWATEWKKSELNDLKFMGIGRDLKMIPLPNKEYYDFWKNVYKNTARSYSVTSNLSHYDLLLVLFFYIGTYLPW